MEIHLLNLQKKLLSFDVNFTRKYSNVPQKYFIIIFLKNISIKSIEYNLTLWNQYC